MTPMYTQMSVASGSLWFVVSEEQWLVYGRIEAALHIGG